MSDRSYEETEDIPVDRPMGKTIGCHLAKQT